MPSITTSIQSLGPIVQLVVAVSAPRRQALQTAGRQVPQIVLVNGLIDTGASSTVVDLSVIQRLQIPASGMVQIMTPSTGATPHDCNQYDVTIAIPLANNELHLIETIPVLEASLIHHGIDALIGRDILKSAILIVNGHHDSLTLCF